MSTDTKTIQLPDGRDLAYMQHGDLSGTPVFFIHGNPGSRLMRHPDESIITDLGVRLITMDRPGYGYSDYQTNRTLLDFPSDLASLADALNIDTFALFGVSAGGPYTAATAYKMPERVRIAAIVSGVAPFDRPNPYEGVNETYTQAFKLSKWPFWLLRPLIWLGDRSSLNDREAYWQEVLGRASRDDREVLQRPEIKEQVLNYLPEATRQGSKGRAREAKILVNPWGFDLSEIQPTVHLWYWEDDTIVPPQMGRYLEQKIPNTVPHFLPNGGHFGFYDHWREILEPLANNNHTEEN
jgi:pimeloyl-ACP methyl ester carboxylesterase